MTFHGPLYACLLLYSRLHWAALARDQVLETWDSSHLGQNTDVSAMAGQDSKTAEDVAVEEEGIPSLFLSPTARELLLDETSTKEATVSPVTSEFFYHDSVLHILFMFL